MIDLHCHILPGVDDGARNVEMSLHIAHAMIADGIEKAVCTPHILPGLYDNTGPKIRASVAELRVALAEADLHLELFSGADAHMAPNFVAKLRSGEILSLAESRYVLVEPPHHVAPAMIKAFFFELLVAGYVPILTHPERLHWIETHYAAIQNLAQSGVWMQITAGSLLNDFGRRARYWAERMLDDGIVHLLATDAHDMNHRPPKLTKGREAAAKRIGGIEAEHLVVTRPWGVIKNEASSNLPAPVGQGSFVPHKSA
jgi:protein-tyrosine phosphatase